MKHYALKLEYMGSRLHGWQQQDNAPTVQGHLREAWRKISGEDINFRGCSRTDAGVSALHHVCDFFTASHIPYERIPQVLNGFLPADMAVKAIREVAEDFDARFDSLGKLYIYRVYNARTRSAVWQHFTVHLPAELNLGKMQKVAAFLEGEHNFAAFMDQGSPVHSTIRRIDRLCVIQDPQVPILSIYCLGTGFLYHQVRILAGTLLYVAMNKLTLEEVQQALEKQDRKLLGKTMPASGLCLARVFYEESLFSGDDRASYENISICSPQDLANFAIFP